MKLAVALFFMIPMIPNYAIAAEKCATSYLGDKFQIAQIDDEGYGTCIYSASAMYNLNGKFKPLRRVQGARWKKGHGGWYCKPKNARPEACRFKPSN